MCGKGFIGAARYGLRKSKQHFGQGFDDSVVFENCIFQTVFFKTVFFQTVFFQTVFFQTVLSKQYFPNCIVQTVTV